MNTRARNVWHKSGPDFRHRRHGKRTDADPRNGAMRQGVERGRDYTPLYRFLVSKVGEPFDAVHQEAIARLDQEEPIWHLVARSEAEKRAIVGVGESTYWTGLFVEDGILKLVDETVGPEQLNPTCPCCTHTLNGVRFTRPFTEYHRPLRD
ncbi:MAG: hypothetical protein AAF318_11685 [Pseudomonadota bacterium]